MNRQPPFGICIPVAIATETFFFQERERCTPERGRRGGCHSQAGRYCRSSNRYYALPEMRSSQDGFRPVLTKMQLDGLHQLTDGTHTDFNQTRTRVGMNTRIWNRRNTKTGDDYVKAGKVHSRRGEAFALQIGLLLTIRLPLSVQGF